jgi:mannose-6-phosphate isomerase
VQPAPFRIEPTFHPRIWGERSLAPIFPDKTQLAEPIGEAWLTDMRCVIANGRFAGKTLRDAWAEIPADWRGARFAGTEEFPLLVKFVFPADKLSIQVHPNDQYAKLYEAAAGGRGKTEMWHIVSARPGAEIFLGLQPGVNKADFSAALGSEAVEKLFQAHRIEGSETFFIPAGVPHSIGPGVVVCEVQQYCDLTYRVYDYNRVDRDGKPRQLHIEKALDVIDFGGGKIASQFPLVWAADKVEISLLVACKYFATEKWRIDELFTVRPHSDSFNLAIFLSGYGELRWEGGKSAYRQGECWFMPASLKNWELIPAEETSLMRTFVPDLQALRANLKMLGIAEAKIAEVIVE